MKMSGGGLLALKQSEGCRLDAYQDEAGVWTIGYGDTHQVKPGDRITLEEAEGLLLLRVDQFERAVRAAVKRPMTQGQFDALTSLCYNIGSAAFSASELVKQFNADEIENAARQFARWIHVKGEEVTVREGERGPDVLEWQRQLTRDGIEVNPDGVFGRATHAATKLWQATHRDKASHGGGEGVGIVRRKVISGNLVQRRFWEVVRFLRP